MSYLVEQVAQIRQQIAGLKRDRVTYRSAEVAAVDTGASTFTADVPGAGVLEGIGAPPQFLPAVGDVVRLSLSGATPTYQPHRIAENAITDVELDDAIVADIGTALTAANGKNTVTYSINDPFGSGKAAGDVWFKRSGTVLVGTWEWDGDSWEPRKFGDQTLDSLTAGKIVTGTLGVGVTINVGDPTGDHVEIDGTDGLTAYVDDPVDGTPNKAAIFGRTSGGIHPVTGEQTWAIDENGNASFRDGSFKSLRVGGTEIGSSLNQYAKGLVAWYDGGKIQSNIIAPFGVNEIYFVSEPNRNGHIDIDMHLTSTVNNGEARVRLHRTLDGSRPTSNSPVVFDRVIQLPVVDRWQYTPLRCFYQSGATAQHTKLLLTIARGDGQTSGTVGTVWTPPSVFYYDDGPAVTKSGTAANDGNPGGTSVAAPVRHDNIIWGSWAQNFRGNGSIRTDTTDLVQGLDPSGFNGDGKAMIGFPDLTGTLSGASIESMWLYLYAYRWYSNSGGEAIIGTHNSLGVASTFSGGARLRIGGWRPAEGRWIDITGWAGEFQSGASRGITLGPSNSGDLYYYGRFLGVSDTAHPDLRPCLRIVYYK